MIKKRFLFVFCISICCFFLASSILIPLFVEKQIILVLNELFQSPVSVDNIELNLMKGRLRVSKLQVRTKDGKDILAALEELKAYITLRYLLDRKLVIEKCTVKKPQFYIVHEKPLEFNISYLLTNIASQKKNLSAKLGFPYFSLENIRIQDGLVNYKDMVQENSPVYVMRDINVVIPQLSNFPKMLKEPVKPKFFARIGKTTVDLAGHSMPFFHGQKSNFTVTMRDIPVKNYMSYFKDYINFDLSSGQIDLQLALFYENKSKDKDSSPLQIKANAEVRNLLGFSRKGNEKLLFVKNMTVDVKNIIPNKRNLVINKAAMEIPKLHLVRSKKGKWNLGSLIKFPHPDNAVQNKVLDYKVTFNNIVCLLDELTLEAETAKMPVESSLKKVAVELETVSLHRGRWNLKNGRINGNSLVVQQNKEPLVNVDKVAASLDPFNTKTGRIVINTIDLHNPTIELLRKDNGKTNFSDIIALINLKPSSFTFKTVNIHQGNLHYLDKTFSSYFETFLDQINGQINEISTQPLAAGDFSLNTRWNSLGSLSLQGALKPDPFTLTFQAAGKNILVHDLFPVYEDTLNIKPPQGRISFKIPAVQLTKQSEGLQLALEGGELSLKDFQAVRANDNRKFAALNTMTASIDQIILNPLVVSFNKVYLSGLGFDLIQTNKGQCGLDGLLKAHKSTRAYEFLVNELVFDNTFLALEDRTKSPAVLFTLENTEGAVDGIHITEEGTYVLGGWTSAKNLDFSQGNNTILQSRQVDVSGGPFDFARDKVEISKINLRHPDLNLVRYKEGLNNLSGSTPKWLQSLVSDNSDTETEITIERVNFNNGILHYTDHGHDLTFRLSSNRLEGSIAGLSNRVRKAGDFRLKGSLNHMGEFTAQGKLRFSPLKTEFALKARDILTQDMFPLFAEYFRFEKIRGYMDLDINKVFLTKFPGESLKARTNNGRAALRNLHIVKTDQPRKSMDIGELTASFDSFSSSPLALKANRVSLDRMSIDLVKQPGKEQNFLGPWLASGHPLSYALYVDELLLKDTSVHFKDLTVNPMASLSLDNVDGTITSINSETKEPVPVKLMGELNQDGSFNIQGQIDLFNKQRPGRLKANLQDVELSFFAPYIQKHMRLRVNRGKLFLNTDIKITNDKIKTENELVISHLDFDNNGLEEKNDSSLETAISLLKDRKGQIKLSLPVTVEFNKAHIEPSFLLTGKIVKNFVKKAATTPYKYLCRLVNGEPKCSVEIVFQPGSTQIMTEMEQYMDEVTALLKDNRDLKFVVTGYSVEDLDVAALQKKKLAEKITSMQKDYVNNPITELYANLDCEQNGYTIGEKESISMQQYEHYMKYRHDREAKQNHRESSWWSEKPDLKRLEEDLCEEIEVKEWELKELARSRSVEAKRFLVEKKGINSKKIYIESPQVIGRRNNLSEQSGGKVVFRLFTE